MIKKLLKNIKKKISFEYDANKIENYLSNSTNRYDLEFRQKKIEKENRYNKFYI